MTSAVVILQRVRVETVVRCERCRRVLAKSLDGCVQLKCPRCGHIANYRTIRENGLTPSAHNA